jgi:hypothetical protein
VHERGPEGMRLITQGLEVFSGLPLDRPMDLITPEQVGACGESEEGGVGW